MSEESKMRGMRFRSSRHDFRITTGGLGVYPRLQVFTEHEEKAFDWEQKA